jgi:uncharacterized protein (TIGR02186 family)
LAVTTPAHCEPLAVDLSHHRIAIHSSFTGAEVLLFGAIRGTGGGDIIVVLSGPNQPVVVRRKARMAGVWLNRSEVVFETAPGYYAVGASGSLDDILDTRQREANRIGLNNIKLVPAGGVTRGSVFNKYSDALLRHKVNQGLYFTEPSPVEFIGTNLFRVRFNFPSNVPPGIYQAIAHQVDDGEVVASGTADLVIRKTGMEARIYGTAHDSPWLYGILAVVLALMAGWLASAIFRRT